MSEQRKAAEALAAEIREDASVDIHGDVSWPGGLADLLEDALRIAAAPARVAWTRDSPGGGCPEEVVVREAGTGYYADAEVVLECEGITGHAGPHFTREVDGHIIAFEQESPDA